MERSELGDLQMAADLVKSPSTSLVYNVVPLRGQRLSRKSIRQSVQDLENSRRRERVDNDLKICAEGDSWINILWPWSSLLGYHRTFFDVIQSKGYHTVDVAYPGDTFQTMLTEKEYTALYSRRSMISLFSRVEGMTF